MSDDGDELGGSFAIFYAEGEVLYKQGHYEKALESFSKALDYQAEDRACLVARSKCYLRLGDTTAALKDAEDSLSDDKTYHRGLYQKAEVLYAMGDFEHALMFYHRGHNVRPQMDEFTLGIQKAQEAINNSIGSPAACKLENIGDLSFFHKQDTVGKKKPKKLLKVQVTQQKKERKVVASEKSVKELLGELYSDREYLDKLMKDPTLMVGRKDRTIYDTIEDALIYLDSRTEFWRQQKPMYARKREKELKRYKPSPTKPMTVKTSSSHQTKEILKSLQEADDILLDGDAEASLKQARKLLKTVSKMRESDLHNKQEILAHIHYCIGNAQLELGEVELSLEHHLKDLEISETLGVAEHLSRSLDSVAKVYAYMGEFDKSILYYERRLPLVASAEENAWLLHELGRCHLEVGQYDMALEVGHKALESAVEANDDIWQLNASMLIAQALRRKGDKEEAAEYFKKTNKLALLLDDEATQILIRDTLDALEREDITDGEGEEQDTDGGEGTGDEYRESENETESKQETSETTASTSDKTLSTSEKTTSESVKKESSTETTEESTQQSTEKETQEEESEQEGTEEETEKENTDTDA